MSWHVSCQYQTAKNTLHTVKSAFWFLWEVVDLKTKLRKILTKGKSSMKKDYIVVALCGDGV
jgi:hypothetical protein